MIYLKEKYKKYFKLNITSLIFIIISFISVTLAWFAYSGVARASIDVPVKAWYIEIEKDGKPVSNDIIISTSEIHPGMDVVNEVVNIKNLGDTDAHVKYAIVSARLFGNPSSDYVIDNETITSGYVEDLLSQEYPFRININLSENYALVGSEEPTIFEVSTSWPLDSDTDELDSYWGKEAYNFQKSEEEKQRIDPGYHIRPAIQVVISLVAEQYLEIDSSSDTNYALGSEVLIDVVSNRRCTTIGPTCLQTYVIDVNNTLGDGTVTLLPNPLSTTISGINIFDTYNNYSSKFSSVTSTWTVDKRSLLAEDIVKIISRDVTGSLLVRSGLSDSIIGNLNYGTRMNNFLNKTINYNGYNKFQRVRFNYLSSENCYWTQTEYNPSNGFAVENIDETAESKLYGNNKGDSCKVLPVIEASKANINNN